MCHGAARPSRSWRPHRLACRTTGRVCRLWPVAGPGCERGHQPGPLARPAHPAARTSNPCSCPDASMSRHTRLERGRADCHLHNQNHRGLGSEPEHDHTFTGAASGRRPTTSLSRLVKGSRWASFLATHPVRLPSSSLKLSGVHRRQITASDAYAVSPAELTATSRRLRAAAGGIAGELATCSTQVQALSGASTRLSHARYEGLFSEWQSSAARLQQAFEGIAELTSRASQVYATGDGASRACLPACERCESRPLRTRHESSGISSHH
jgi:WXG100 family type VII secretion target